MLAKNPREPITEASPHDPDCSQWMVRLKTVVEQRREADHVRHRLEDEGVTIARHRSRSARTRRTRDDWLIFGGLALFIASVAVFGVVAVWQVAQWLWPFHWMSFAD